MNGIETLRTNRDIHGLIRLLDHGNADIQWHAADALGTLGEAACEPLMAILDFPKMHVRLGAIEALGDIRSGKPVDELVRKLKSDPDNEVRWVATLALGQIGDRRAIPALEAALRDKDRYVRYGAVMSLEMLSWTPESEDTLAYMLIAQQEWDTLRGMNAAAVGPLVAILADPNPRTRLKIVELLSEIATPEATAACTVALMDRDAGVRWKAVLACRRCGVSRPTISRILANRPDTRPSAMGAALLNLLFLGLGFHYLQKWWGYLLFMIFMTIMVFLQLESGIWFPLFYVLPITGIAAVYTYYTVLRQEDM
jgi:HEAT repeat protein